MLLLLLLLRRRRRRRRQQPWVRVRPGGGRTGRHRAELRRNLLNIDSLDSLKQKLTKVIIVALIVTAFKLMVSMEVSSVSDLLQYCGGVLMLAFSSWLISRSGNQHS